MGSVCMVPFFFSVLLSRLELSDTTIYEPQIRALLGTAPHFCQGVDVELRTVPLGTAQSVLSDASVAFLAQDRMTPFLPHYMN